MPSSNRTKVTGLMEMVIDHLDANPNHQLALLVVISVDRETGQRYFHMHGDDDHPEYEDSIVEQLTDFMDLKRLKRMAQEYVGSKDDAV